MTEGASSRLFNPLSFDFHRQPIWIRIQLLQGGEHMGLTLHLDHFLVLFIEDPNMIRVGGVGAAGRRRPPNLYCAEGGRGGHGDDRIESLWERNGI